jgi:hypothetical protein
MTASLLLLAALAQVPPADCTSCHLVQSATWGRSRHSQTLDGPLYKAMRAWAAEEAGEAFAARCQTCHTVAIAGTEARTPGVTCAACHQGSQRSEGPAGWIVNPAAAVASSRHPSRTAPHPVQASPLLADGSVCLTCHAELHNAAGVPLCTTGPEAASLGLAGSCLGCHVADSDHRFPGTTPELLARAATVTASREAGVLLVRLHNSGTGHALPTGSALRQIRLAVVFLDRAGAPLHEPEPVTLARVLADDAGNAPAPPWRATRVARDTRLGPGEIRELRFELPRGAAKAMVSLTYHRAPAPLAKRLGVADHPSLQPITMALVEVEELAHR